jgi:hypothetical protein
MADPSQRTGGVRAIESPTEVVETAQRLRDRALRCDLSPAEAIAVLERWGEALQGSDVESVPGVPFLRLWLRRGTLEPLLERELGPEALHLQWHEQRGARLRAFPLGVIGHWPAGNIEIQPVLSLTCSLLAGNAALVRVPSGLVDQTRAILQKLREVDVGRVLTERIALATFDHARTDLQRAMAASVDGAMIWGGREAVTELRALPFPHWARVLAFGPRLSVAAMDGATWGDEVHRESWCRRLARDVWQFDQQACSSPQTLFLERRLDRNAADFVTALSRALQEENRLHPRRQIEPALTSAICLARATWLLGGADRSALFPAAPDWTVLVGTSPEIPPPVQGRTLTVQVIDSLLEPIARFGGEVQTLGLAVDDAEQEEALVHAAAANGVDRIVKLGTMHIFGSPWDGTELVRPQVRWERHVPAHSR